MDRAATSMGVQISLQDSDFIFFTYIHISEIAESYDSSFLFFFLNLFIFGRAESSSLHKGFL